MAFMISFLYACTGRFCGLLERSSCAGDDTKVPSLLFLWADSTVTWLEDLFASEAADVAIASTPNDDFGMDSRIDTVKSTPARRDCSTLWTCSSCACAELVLLFEFEPSRFAGAVGSWVVVGTTLKSALSVRLRRRFLATCFANNSCTMIIIILLLSFLLWGWKANSRKSAGRRRLG